MVKAELDRKGDGKPLPDEEAVKVLRALKEIALEQGNAFEVAFLDRFLPQEMSEEEIEPGSGNTWTSPGSRPPWRPSGR